MSEFFMVAPFVLLWVVTAWVFYLLVKAAVRNGILEADVVRRRIARGLPTGDRLEQHIAESRAAFPDETP